MPLQMYMAVPVNQMFGVEPQLPAGATVDCQMLSAPILPTITAPAVSVLELVFAVSKPAVNSALSMFTLPWKCLSPVAVSADSTYPASEPPGVGGTVSPPALPPEQVSEPAPKTTFAFRFILPV